MNFNFKLFSFKYIGISLKGYINVATNKNNEMSIIFKLTYKILKEKEKEIISLEPYKGSSKEICNYINKLGEFEKYIEKHFIKKEVIKIIIDIISIINIRELFNDPYKILVKLYNKFSNKIMNLLTYLLGKINDFINQYFEGFKSQIFEYFISLNNSFLKSFFLLIILY